MAGSAWRLPALGLVLAALLAGTGYLAGRLLQPEVTSQPVVELATATGCEPIGRACSVGADSGMRVGLRLASPVTPLQPFAVEVTAQGTPRPVTAVHVDFIMVGMDMGMNRYRLDRASDAEASSSWRGRSTLPVCSADRLDWVAVVTVETDSGAYRARFPFRAIPPR